MTSEFLSQLGEISPALPTLFRFLLVGTTAAALWLVLSVPAFWLLRVLEPVFHKLTATLKELRARLLSQCRAALQTRGNPIDSFISTHAQMFSFAVENAAIKSAIIGLRKKLDHLPDRQAQMESALKRVADRIASDTGTLENLETPTRLEPPAAQEFAKIQKGTNQAVIALLVSIVFLPAFVGFNVGMLNEFLAGFWPGLEYRPRCDGSHKTARA